MGGSWLGGEVVKMIWWLLVLIIVMFLMHDLVGILINDSKYACKFHTGLTGTR